jgi:hypothetical protein
MREVKCRISKVSQIESDTLLIDIEAEQKFSLEDFYELKKAALSIGEGASFYNIITVGPYTLPDKDAREHSCSVEGSYYKKADAFVISTLSQKIVCNLMLRLNKPHVPTKCFKTILEAEEWVKKLKLKNESQILA